MASEREPGDPLPTDFVSKIKSPKCACNHVPELKPPSWAVFNEGVIKEHPERSDSNSRIFTEAKDIRTAAG
jgi:hypothetical protein